jgi:hypothetical protein
MKIKIVSSIIVSFLLIQSVSSQIKVMNTTGNVAIGNITDPGGYKLYVKNNNFQLLSGGNEGIGANMLRIFNKAGCGFSVNSDGPNLGYLATVLGINYSIDGGSGDYEFVLNGLKKAPVIQLNAENGSIAICGESGSGSNYRYPDHHIGIHVNSNGFVGIGRYHPDCALDIAGEARVDGALVLTSDARLKENISQLNTPLKKMARLQGVTYKFKAKNKYASQFQNSFKNKLSNDSLLNKEMETNIDTSITNRTQIGFLAQELQKVYPELVSSSSDGILSINYIGLIPVLVEAVKELSTKDSINLQLQLSLQSELQQTKNRMDVYEKKLASCCGKSNLKSASVASNIEGTNEESSLLQNTPNPFTQSTLIGYCLPETIANATLYIYNMNGNQLKSITLNHRGKSTVTINGNEFQPGMYIYTLVADGKEVDTKRMILTD